ncbi:hypothetical protein [Streptomyces sp. NPDC058739]|uniref:hypothetical protein n=1 Tax=Streptomyces sp. NPDC058739 TaxID=3346618 RepID=UPI0036BA5E12
MLALRLSRGARPAVQLRRLLVAAASAGTGFLLLCALGHALTHPDSPAASALRLAWCAAPLAATVHFAVAVARADPGTRPRAGLSALGLGPARLMAVSATTTVLSTLLGSMLALLFFLHLRGDLTGMPFDGDAADVLAADRPLPLPGALTLLSLVPVIASVSVAVALRPREPRRADAPRVFGRFGAYGRAGSRDTFGAYGRFGARSDGPRPDSARSDGPGAGHPRPDDPRRPIDPAAEPVGHRGHAASVTHQVPAPAKAPAQALADTGAPEADPRTPAPRPTALPWGIATLAAGLTVEAYSSRTAAPGGLPLPGGLTGNSAGVLLGWALTAVGLALAGPGLTHLCGRLLQSVRPGALRLLSGRVLMDEATRIGRPLGVVCAVASAAYAMGSLYDPAGDTIGPLTTLGTLLVAGCTLATLLTAAVEAKHSRADTTAALLRLGAPATTLRMAAALRAGALLALFGPVTLIVAELAAQPLTG